MLRSHGISEPGVDRIELTRMRRRHLRGVMAIERQVYARPWSPNLFIVEMSATTDRCYIVARSDKTVVGYSGLISYGDEAHITNIAVDPKRQRQRIGMRLLLQQMEEAIRLGAHAVSLEVRVTNWGAQRLYGRFGFHPVGIRRNYYQELHEDALIMWTDDLRTAPYRGRLDAIADDLADPSRPA